MKRIGRKALALLLCLILFSGLLPFAVFAEETDELLPDPDAEVVVLETVTEYNPLFSSYFTPEQIDALEAPSMLKGTKAAGAAATPEYATTPEDAGAQLRAGMKARQNQFSVYVRIPKSIFDEYGANMIKDAIWENAIIVTCNGIEGDYLNYSWLRKSCTSNYTTDSGGAYVFLTINYSFTYNTDSAQESEMAVRAAETVGYFGFTRHTSAYDKILTIYDYIAANIRYATDDHLDTPIYYSAYSAIVMKETVCQGYAQLLYYMLWLCEIPCRIVVGNNHAWNLVWLRGQWYSLDVTWDNALSPKHDFFLRGKNTGFYGDGTNNTHLSDENLAYLVLDTSPYDYGNKRSSDYGSCETHINASSTYSTDDGSICYWCSICGQSATGPFGTYRYINWGPCGDNSYFTLDSEGRLDVTGSGDIWDNAILWFPNRNEILEVKLSGQITSIGKLAFDHEEYLTSISLPINVTRIGESAFRGCNSLKNLLIRNNISIIEINAFSNCSALSDVYYIGTPAQWDAIAINSGNTCLTNARRHYACTITFDANGGTGEMDTTYSFTGLNETLASNAFSREGYVFSGWNTAADGSGTSYTDGATVLLSGNLTLYAQWKSNLNITKVTANKTSAQKGDTITWTATSSGGIGTVKYCFYIYKDGAIIERGTYSTEKTYSYVPKSDGTYTAKAFAKDSTTTVNKMSSATMVGAVSPLSLTGITANKASTAPGETITWTASASGGSAPLQYCFYIFKNGKIIERGDYGTTKTCSYKANDPGTYTVRVYVKDASGTVLNLTSAGTVVSSPLVLNGITANKTSAAPGETITWTANTSGGTAVQYCFYIFKNGKVVERGAYGTAKTCSYKANDPGTYTARVYVKDASGTALNLTSAGTVVSSPLVLNGISANKTSAAPGETVTWTANTSGGSSVQYCFYIFKNGKVIQRGDYGTAKTYSYTTTEPGTYSARVYVKDGTSAALIANSANTVVSSPLVLNGITADKTSAAPGETITWTVDATGGNAVQFCFYIFKDGKVIERGAYGTARTCTYTPDAPGIWSVRVYVKEGSATQQLNGGQITVVSAEPLSVQTVTADTTTASTGTPVTWTAAASGGTGSLQYCFYVFKDGKVVQRGSYGSARTVTYTPTAAGTYTVRVYVKDAAGTVVTQDNAAPVTVS